MKNYKIAVAGTGYVGLSLGVLLSQHHQVVAVDIVQAKVDMINNKKSPMNMFEDFIGYQGSAVLDEPVREEDSFSKESMSQESEISENILLPDLAKQSESIEQQSGEIAERGMPT